MPASRKPILAGLTDLILALAPSAERVTELQEQGRAFALAISAITGADHPARPYPIAVGAATAALNVSTTEVLTLWLQGLAAQLTSAAVRFVPLGQTDGQKMLARLAPRITALAAEYAEAPLSALHSSALRADIAAMRHETLARADLPHMNNPNSGFSAHDQPQRPLARRHRRPGRCWQNHADRTSLPRAWPSAARWPRSPMTSTPARTPIT